MKIKSLEIHLVRSYRTASFSYESTYVVSVSLEASQEHPEIPAVGFVFSDREGRGVLL